MTIIDLHTHILPGVDDGPQTWQQSLDIAELLSSQGVSTIFATPHILNKNLSSNINIKQLCRQLNEKITANGIELKVIPGAELYIEPFTKFDKSFYKEFTMGDSKYLLIEFSLNCTPHNWEEFRFQAELSGYNLIIAHPERYHGVDLNWMETTVTQGAYLQANSASFLGHYGKKPRQLAFQGLNSNLFQFIASDVHNITTRKSYFSSLEEIINSKNFEQLCRINPELLLKNKNVPIKPMLKENKSNNSILGNIKEFLS